MNRLKTFFSIDWMRNNKVKVVLFIVIVLTGIFFYNLNILYPIYIDDWTYSFNMVDGKKIDSFSAILESQYAHYFQWGGRVILHIIAQVMLWFGKFWADILNTLAYIGLVYVIYSIANKGNKTNPILFMFINILIWFTLPSFSQNILWKTGSANYLWGGLIFFSFILFYASYYFAPVKAGSNVKSIGMFILGVLAGWTNENMAVALIFFLIVFVFLLKYQKKEIPKWMIFGLIGAIISCTVMLLSPGNAIRSKNDLWVAHKMHEMELSFYFYRFVTVTKLARQYLLMPFIVYLVSFALFLWKGKSENKKQVLYLSLLFLCTAGVATAVMSGSPMFPERAWFGIILLLITSIMILYANIELTALVPRILNYSVFAIIFIIYLISCKESYTELQKFSQVCEKRDGIIRTEKDKGIQDIVVNDHYFHQKDSPLVVLDLQDWMMIDPGWARRVGRYYGVNTVVFKEIK